MSVHNTILWDQLKETDPKFTKRVAFGRKFTTIDAMWQVKRMTEIFGPVGKDWSYRTETKFVGEMPIVCICEVTIIWNEQVIEGKRSIHKEHCYGPVPGCATLLKENNRVDEDAPKKAMTDGMTKAFSHLGLSADVFMGAFDNIKYLSKLEEKYNVVIDKKSGTVTPVKKVISK
jgi:hypothetical protein